MRELCVAAARLPGGWSDGSDTLRGEMRVAGSTGFGPYNDVETGNEAEWNASQDAPDRYGARKREKAYMKHFELKLKQGKLGSLMAAVLLAGMAMVHPGQTIAQPAPASVHGHVQNAAGQPVTKGEVKLT